MTNHPMLAAVVVVLLIGALVGWCAGWVARGEQNRGWHAGVVRQLAQTRAQLDQTLDQLDRALDELDHARAWQAQRVPPAPGPTVQVHVAPALPSWLPQHRAVRNTAHIVTAMPVLPAKEVCS